MGSFPLTLALLTKKPALKDDMKNWPSILERAIEDVNEAFDINIKEYGRYLLERGGRGRPAAACHLDVEYERTDQALKAAWQRIADLPKADCR